MVAIDDCWTDECGSEMEIIDHQHCVEIVSHNGDSILLAASDALRVYAGLERWLAKNQQPAGLSSAVVESCDCGGSRFDEQRSSANAASTTVEI